MIKYFINNKYLNWCDISVIIILLAVIIFNRQLWTTCSLIASSPRFYCPTHSFQTFGVPITVGLLGVKLLPSLSTGSTYNYSVVLLRLSFLWRYPIGSLFSLHMYDTEYSSSDFIFVPCAHCCEFGNLALHRDRLYCL